MGNQATMSAVSLLAARVLDEGVSMAFDVFKRAWAVFTNQKYLGPALAIMLCSGAASVLLAWYFGPTPAPVPSFRLLASRLAASSALIALGAWPGGSLVALAIALARDEDASLTSRFLSLGTYIRYVVVIAAFAIVVGIATVCLIVPGIFAFVVWSQAPQLVVDGKADVFGAFQRSRDLTRGSRGEVFATCFALMVTFWIPFGISIAIRHSLGPTLAEWQWTILNQVWLVPFAVFSTATYAALYVELVKANRPLTSAEFSFASPLTR
jgi:hypothetical protein